MPDIMIGSLVTKEQRKVKPKVEEIILEQLHGETRQVALEFIAYLRANKMSPTWSSKNNWKCSYKGKPLCWVKINHDGRNEWQVCFMFEINNFDQSDIDEELLQFYWANPARCTYHEHCHGFIYAKGEINPNEEFAGFKRTIIGKEFDNMCWLGGVSFPVNPDKKTIEYIKKTLLLRRSAIMHME